MTIHDNSFAVKLAFLLKCLTWIRVLRSSSFLSLSCDCFVELQDGKNLIFDENGLMFIFTILNEVQEGNVSQVCPSVILSTIIPRCM